MFHRFQAQFGEVIFDFKENLGCGFDWLLQKMQHMSIKNVIYGNVRCSNHYIVETGTFQYLKKSLLL